MENSSTGNQLIETKTLMAKILRLYYLTNSIAEKEELQLKYTELEKHSQQYNEDSLTEKEKAQLERLNHYSELYEEYHKTNSTVRKAEIEEIFLNIENTEEVNN
ncbi:hypothetical protein [Paenibacillus illinoisensis]|uniref:hypothetical protein n=1 Tax=Paenibacillus illinoisensis TaxID=59845 RepID=UPI001C8E415D|nr:hypothetical protein [Paenibacillus illinoisensis]MBY0217921.1 hypothetical protein [Paenibacillus illinoisensis]